MELREAEYAKGLARAFGGAILFAVPLIMTMEMWELGVSMSRERMILFVAVDLVLLVGMSHFSGFEETSWWSDDVLDAFAAFGIGAAAGAAMLACFGILEADMSLDEIAGKVTLQAIPASIGAVLARKQLGQKGERDSLDERAETGYAGELFLMAVGALFFAFNVAPTEEMAVIAYKMTPWHAIAVVLASILVLHALVYALGLAGQENPPEGAGFGRTLIHYSIAGYGIAVLISLYVLWTFGRTDAVSIGDVVQMTAVLGFPASLGAAVARLII